MAGCRRYGHELTTVADLLDSNSELVLQVPGDPDLSR